MTLANPAPSLSHTQRLTRDDIVRLGQSNRPWDFLPIAEQALRIAPEDVGLLLLAAANYAKLSLRTPAREKLAAIPPTLRSDPGVQQLTAAIDRLPDDRIPLEHRLHTCRANLQTLLPRLPHAAAADLEAALPTWELHTRDEEWFRAADTNTPRRVEGGGAWTHLADLATLARSTPLPAGESPLTIEGADPPHLLLRALRESPRRPDGFHRCIRLVEPDTTALLNALATTDLRAELAQPRLHLFLGPSAATSLAADLDTRLGAQIIGPILTLPSRHAPSTAAPILAEASAHQAALQGNLLAQVAAIYDPRDTHWWSRRYAAALDTPTPTPPTPADPLRVLLLTHRFSTFIRHSTDDLAAALRARGCRVEVLMEPDDSHLHTSVGYLQALARLQPDLILTINYTRRNFGPFIPANVPLACWIQDAMPHLFDEKVGRAQSPLDFLVGHLHPELFTLYGYPRERSLPTPVLASEHKFHPAPVPKHLADAHTCEIAYAGNQSETPEALRDRLIAQSAASPTSVRAIGALYERIKDICADTMLGRVSTRLEAAAQEELARLGVPPDPRHLTSALNGWARPLADRILRHETARWAAELAHERNWRFHLYGRGWEAHPTLHPFAKGPLDHGEDLRASYQCAAVHLHASVNWSLHQRIMECALSGGLPLCRLKRDDLSPIESYVIRSLIERSTPVCTRLDTRAHIYYTADSPEALAAAALFQRLNLPITQVWSIQKPWRDDPSTYDGGQPMDHDTAWLLGDLAETTFTTKESLAATITRATTRPNWRTNSSRAIATRVHRRLTYTSAAKDLLTLIRTSLPQPPRT